ncbi:MAG: SDR family oxidoreductase [Candidatus Sericytochromatia bacterium]
MAKTVLITGSSTGIGRATAFYFQEKGWNVAATMRTPEKEKDLRIFKNVICPKLDVTNIDTIKNAIQETLDKFGDIDAIVNNAGYGLAGAFEGATKEQIQKQFDTNVFGLMDVIKEILPHFRSKQKGVIVNVSSVGGKVTFPLFSLYHASKWAIEGFSESLQYELAPFNIKVRIIEPGGVKTDFAGRSLEMSKPENTTDYDKYVEKITDEMMRSLNFASEPITVAKTIYTAVNSNSSKLRYTSGLDAAALTKIRKITSDTVFTKMIKTTFKL